MCWIYSNLHLSSIPFFHVEKYYFRLLSMDVTVSDFCELIHRLINY